MLATSNHTSSKENENNQKKIFIVTHENWYMYEIFHFGSTGKSTPHSMKKNSSFVNLSWLQLDLNFITK